MIVNYLKLALKILRRKKFFTFINLFGISFTLMILTLLIAFLDNMLGANAPLSNMDRMVTVQHARMFKEYFSHTYEIDTNYVDGLAVYDTVNTETDRSTSMSSSSPSYYLLDAHFNGMDGVEGHTYFSNPVSFNIFIHNKKINLSGIYADANYWNIFDFSFVEGGPFHNSDVDGEVPVIVINEKTREKYFGYDVLAIGKEISFEKKRYKVIGVVKNVTNTNNMVSGDVIIPLTHSPGNIFSKEKFLGTFNAVFLLEKGVPVSSVKDQINLIAKNVQLPEPERFDQLEVVSATIYEETAQDLIYFDEPELSAIFFNAILTVVILLFILIPTLNLVNINVTRIMERSSEIGVRKAFGAKVSDLLFQFIFENVVITLIGGTIGFLLSVFAINSINSSGVFPKTTLEINWTIFMLGLITAILFGIISGLAPAYKMSRISIIKALKNA